MRNAINIRETQGEDIMEPTPANGIEVPLAVNT